MKETPPCAHSMGRHISKVLFSALKINVYCFLALSQLFMPYFQCLLFFFAQKRMGLFARSRWALFIIWKMAKYSCKEVPAVYEQIVRQIR